MNILRFFRRDNKDDDLEKIESASKKINELEQRGEYVAKALSEKHKERDYWSSNIIRIATNKR